MLIIIHHRVTLRVRRDLTRCGKALKLGPLAVMDVLKLSKVVFMCTDSSTDTT